MSIFLEISLLLVIATVIAAWMRLFKQPLVMGYILTGLIVGPLFFGFVHSQETIEVFSEFGVSILLFIVGLHLSPKVAREVGRVALIAGVGQIFVTSFLGFLAAKAFNYSTVEALYIAAAVTFSSTIIVLKFLSDKRDIDKLYGKISVGLLLVQDIVATFALIFVSATSASGNAGYLAFLLLLKGIAIGAFLILISIYALPKLSTFFAKSQEFLFLFSIGWGFGLASLFNFIGFSVEIGALIAGVALSVSPYSHEISSKLKPLRDFFIIMFFVFLGSSLTFDSISTLLWPIIVLSVFVLIVEPVIIFALMGALGYNRKTSFQSGLAMAQVSEFSLILVLLGKEVGHINNDVLSLITLLAIITIAASTYLIMYSEKLYPLFAPYLGIFERKKIISESDILSSYEVVLFGAHRVGYDFVKLFNKLGQSFLVVDFDPDLVAEMSKTGINARYGDAEDGEFLDSLNLEKTKMVISTIPEYETNEYLISKIRPLNEDVIIISICHDIDEALKLYEKGASYVILPHFIGGHFAAMLAAEHWFNIDRFTAEKDKHVAYLKERKELGHNHPAHWADH